MRLTACIAYTDPGYHNMARVCARTLLRHTPGLRVRLVECEHQGHTRNMGTRFRAYVDRSADWVLALDADSLCFGNAGSLVRRAEDEGLAFVGRLSGRPRRAPRAFDQAAFCRLFRRAGLHELALHVPNVFLVRGSASAELAELAARWTERLYQSETHVLGRALWSDQVGFTLALAELRLAPEQLGFFRPGEVADWGHARRLSPRPIIVHFGTRRWRRLWTRGRILEMTR